MLVDRGDLRYLNNSKSIDIIAAYMIDDPVPKIATMTTITNSIRQR